MPLPHRRVVARLVAALAPALLTAGAFAQELSIEPSPLVGDGAVLQRESRVTLWGRTAPGAEVEVRAEWLSFAPSTRADGEGRFRVELGTGAAGGPYAITYLARAADGGEARRVVRGVHLGEVWLASGQSNMEWSVRASSWDGLAPAEYERAVASAGDPLLSFFQVPNRTAVAPERDVDGAWVAATPASVPGFSAVALHFARRLRAELGVPVGVVQADWGGTVCEAWTSAEALRALGGFDAALDELAAERERPGSRQVPLATLQDRWWRGVEAHDPGLAERWYEGELDRAAWREVTVPGDPDPSFDGCLWLRRELELPASWAGRDLLLHLGPIDDMDRVFLGGREVGATKVWGRWADARRYRVPGEHVRGGRVTLAVLCVDPTGGAGLHGRAADLVVHPEGAPRDRVELAGTWWYRRGASMGELGTYPQQGWFGPNHPTALFNGMIAPLEPLRLRGAIWYQGESNARRAEQYARLFPTMIADWRARFRGPDEREPFPFYFVQIAPCALDGIGDAWAELRLAQAAVLPDARGVPERFHRAALDHVGMVVTADVGDPNDIHPRRKRPVGERLADWALARTYAPLAAEAERRADGERADGERAEGERAARWRALPTRSPEPVAARRDGAAVVVELAPFAPVSSVADDGTAAAEPSPADALLTRDGRPPTHFELAGPDGRWHAARAELVGTDAPRALRLASDAVPDPVRVRFAWEAGAVPNLSTRRGLAVGPFVVAVE